MGHSKVQNKTALITGCSSGIGRAIAFLFQNEGMNVSASMRNPAKEIQLNSLENTICPQLDVNDQISIERAISETVKRFGTIDILVNNAGYGLVGPFEGASDEQIFHQFNTNVLGLMRVTRSVLPFMRSQRSGTVINMSSMGGRIGFPSLSLYVATKWAVEGFSESLRHELKTFNIALKLIEPGLVKTQFQEGSIVSTAKLAPADYQDFARAVSARYAEDIRDAIHANEVAQVVLRAATDQSERFRFSVGGQAKRLLFAKKILGDIAFNRLMKWMYKLN